MTTSHPDHSHDDTSIDDAYLVEVSNSIYAYIQPDGTWWINNTGFVVGDDHVISIDGCATERRTRAYIEHVASISELPIRILVNTHHHGDHTFGNHLFDDATIIGHEKCRDGIIDWGAPRSAPFWSPADWGDFRLKPPFLTYREGVTLYAGDIRCEVSHVANAAHTTNDSIVWIPERSVLFAGDLLFNGGTPFLVQGSIAGAIEVLETVVVPLGAATIVPGHGPVATGAEVPKLIADVIDYLRFVQTTAADGKRARRSPLETAQATDLGRFAPLSDSERIVGNLHRAYAEIDGAAPGDLIDVAAALTDMITYNGGRPLSCHV